MSSSDSRKGQKNPTNEECDPLLVTSGVYHLKTAGHGTYALTNMHEMKQRGQLCDVKIKVGLKTFKVHRVVLAAISPYFFEMFNDEINEGVHSEIVLHDIDDAIVELLLDYAYTGEITITPDNVQVLLPASGLLQIKEVREGCCHFLTEQLHPTNCFGIRRFADAVLQRIIGEVTLFRPSEFSTGRQYGGVFIIVVHGGLFHSIKGGETADQYALVSVQKIEGGRVSNTRYSECEVYNPRSDSWSSIAPMRCKRSSSGVIGLHRLLYAVGGYDGVSYLATAECYDPLVNTWTSITPMGAARSNLGICSFDGLMYVCGGEDEVSNWRSMEKFDPLTGAWYSCPAMRTIRGGCHTAVVENCIYAIGGPNFTNYSIERFDPREGNWSPVSCMSSILSYSGVAALDRHLYCIGGYTMNKSVASGERFDIRKNAWEPISAMHSDRRLHQVVAIHGCLYALGGESGSSALNSVEKYDPKTNKWYTVSSMMVGRANIGAAVLDCIDIEHILKRTGS